MSNSRNPRYSDREDLLQSGFDVDYCTDVLDGSVALGVLLDNNPALGLSTNTEQHPLTDAEIEQMELEMDEYEASKLL